jgi:hypothetical protein
MGLVVYNCCWSSPAQSFSGLSPAGLMTTFYVLFHIDSIFCKAGGPGPQIYTPRKRVARLYPYTLGSFSVASYDSQGYGGVIRPRLHTGRHYDLYPDFLFSPMALQPKFLPWPTSMKISISLQFTRSYTFVRTPWAGDQLVARPLRVQKHRKTHTHKYQTSMS